MLPDTCNVLPDTNCLSNDIRKSVPHFVATQARLAAVEIMALTSYLVQYLQLSALIFAIEHFPEDTPSRWNAISMYVLQYVALQKSETQDDVIEPMTVNCFRPGQKGKKQKLEFDGSREVFTYTVLCGIS